MLCLHSLTLVFCLIVKFFLSILFLDPQPWFFLDITNYSVNDKNVHLTIITIKIPYLRWRNRKQCRVVTSEKHTSYTDSQRCDQVHQFFPILFLEVEKTPTLIIPVLLFLLVMVFFYAWSK